MAGLNSIITGIAIAGGLIAFAHFGGGYLDRADDAFDEVTDADSRTAAFANEVRGETTRKGAGGGGCAKAGRLGESHSQVQSNRTGQVAK